MNETYVYNSAEVDTAGQLDFHRSRVVSATLSELAVLDTQIDFEGIVPNSMERGAIWQQYGQICALIGSRAVRTESRLYHPCQKDVANVAGEHVALLVDDEQTKRLSELHSVLTPSPLDAALETRVDADRVVWRFKRQWYDISPSERHTPEVISRLASELILTTILGELRTERAAITELYETAVAV